jgi:hypothetical protein
MSAFEDYGNSWRSAYSSGTTEMPQKVRTFVPPVKHHVPKTCFAFREALAALESVITKDHWANCESTTSNWTYRYFNSAGLKGWVLINRYVPDHATLGLFFDDNRHLYHGYVDIGQYDSEGLPHPKTRQILNECFKTLEYFDRLKYQTRIHAGNYHKGKTVISCNGYECPFEPNPDHDHRRVIDFVVNNHNVIEFI